MIASASDVVKAMEEYVLAGMRDRTKPKKSRTVVQEYPFFGGGFSLASHTSDEEEVVDEGEAPQKLAIAERTLEAYVTLRVMRALKEFIEESNARQQDQAPPEGWHELYPEQFERARR